MRVVNFLQRERKKTVRIIAFVQEKLILFISECQLVTKINVGHQMSSVTTVVALLKVG